MQLADYQHELELVKQKLDQHLDKVTKLQEQIDTEEEAIFVCVERERELICSIEQVASH